MPEIDDGMIRQKYCDISYCNLFKWDHSLMVELKLMNKTRAFMHFIYDHMLLITCAGNVLITFNNIY